MIGRAPFAVLLVWLAACKRHEHDDEKKEKSDEHDRGKTTEAPANTPAAEAIRAYESASDCPSREQEIVYPAQNHELLIKLGCSRRTSERFDTWECDQAGSKTCHATARTDKNKKRYWLVKQPTGRFLVDFRATERPNHMDTFRQLPPSTPYIVRGRAYASTSYSGEFKNMRKTHYAVRLRPLSGESDAALYAYVARDSVDGRALEALAGATGTMGDFEITLAIAYPSTKQNADVVAIKKFIAPDLFESDAENAFEAADGGT